jgi:DNA-binding IclR family transcriptional regulator
MYFSEPVSLSELAKHCGMQPSTVHRYLASFQRSGLVAQMGRSGKYLLGKGALQLGLAAIGRHDFVNIASDGLADLRSDTHLTALLSVWGNEGATVIRWERAATPTVTSMGLGTILPLLNSATGRAFLAWAPRPLIQSILDSELRRARRNPHIVSDMEPSNKGVEAVVRQTRDRGFAAVEGKFIPGLVATAVPILDWQNEAQAVVTLIGTDPAALGPGSKALTELLAFGRDKSISQILTSKPPPSAPRRRRTPLAVRDEKSADRATKEMPGR